MTPDPTPVRPSWAASPAGQLKIGVLMLVGSVALVAITLYVYRLDARIQTRAKERCAAAVAEYKKAVEDLKDGATGATERVEENRQEVGRLLDDYLLELEHRQSQGRILPLMMVAVFTVCGVWSLAGWWRRRTPAGGAAGTV